DNQPHRKGPHRCGPLLRLSGTHHDPKHGPRPQRLKPVSLFALGGTAEAVPFPRRTLPQAILPSSAPAATAGMATTVTSLTASRAIAIAIAAPGAGRYLSPTFWTRGPRLDRRNYSIHTVEVRLLIRVELCTAFDHCCGCTLRHCGCRTWRWRIRCRVRFRRRRRPAHLGALLFQNRLPRQFDPVAFDRQNLHQHLVAFFQFIANILDSVLGDFADVQQSVQARQNLDERAEIREPADPAEISLPYLGRSGQIADDLQSLVRRDFIVRRYVDFAGIFHVDLYAGLLDDAANHLATGPNHVANLVHRNLQGVDTRRIRRDLHARLAQNLVHLFEDEQAPTLRLRQRFPHDLRSDSRNLNIHLQRGDAVFGSGNFEIHVAVMI